MSDAAHLLSDLLSFFIGIISVKMAKRGKTKKLNFGYERAEVIGALLSILMIWILTVWLVLEAFDRIVHNETPINAYIMLITSIIALICNLVMGG